VEGGRQQKRNIPEKLVYWVKFRFMRKIVGIFAVFALLVSFAKPYGGDITDDLCDKRWRLSQKVTASGKTKPSRAESENYMLFNPDNTTIIYENGVTFSATWIYNDIIKLLTLTYRENDRYEEFVVYKLDRRNLVLLDLRDKVRIEYNS
jgi:hypothetical protein